MRVSPVVFALLLAATCPTGAAGSQSKPEITDHDTLGDFRDFTVGAPEIDIKEVWFGSTSENLSVHFAVEDLAHRLKSDEWVNFDVNFDCGGDGFDVVMLPAPPPGWGSSAQVLVWRANGTFETKTLDLTIQGNVASTVLPRSLLRCTSSTCTAASSVLQLPPATFLIGPYQDFAPGQGKCGDDFTLT